MSHINPCQTCGACCAHYQISLYPDESNAYPGGTVPVEYTVTLNDHSLCMKGTNLYPPRCAALEGEVGKQVSCSIYDNRPNTCREFNVYELDGSPNTRCFKLRGLTPPATIQP
ncbi:MAG: YkgJ family cysteine cluster protein [Sideroxydans sp.]|nr:YkgJ family cysteine cluster protein [Sideroxydans sp.]